ncbi:MAG: YtxH domain-containing protein [Anaerolineae bacterium]|nr:YtxH domain-containing protein [Anaerolineae bacterium]
MRKFFGFLAGILSGALIGAIFALLFAPMSGEKLRSETQLRLDKVVADVKTAVTEERQRLEAELEALKKGEIEIA